MTITLLALWTALVLVSFVVFRLIRLAEINGKMWRSQVKANEEFARLLRDLNNDINGGGKK